MCAHTHTHTHTCKIQQPLEAKNKMKTRVETLFLFLSVPTALWNFLDPSSHTLFLLPFLPQYVPHLAGWWELKDESDMFPIIRWRQINKHKAIYLKQHIFYYMEIDLIVILKTSKWKVCPCAYYNKILQRWNKPMTYKDLYQLILFALQ